MVFHKMEVQDSISLVTGPGSDELLALLREK